MRGKVTDQDLTNYALNELSPEERLYVESMLGVSEECRHDVYQMLELSEMLKDGFEEREDAADLLLNNEQRSRVLTVARFHWRGFFQRAAAIALLATGIGYGLDRSDILRRSSDNITKFSKFAEQNIATTAEQFNAWKMKARGGASDESQEMQMVQASECTPPTFIADIPPMPEPSGGAM